MRLGLIADVHEHVATHEIGHAMTLKHPGKYGSGDEGPFLPASKENNKYSVMSYKDNPDSGTLAGQLMLYDVAALQKRFGANLQYHTGDDVYTGPDGELEVLWDAGGTDAINGAGYHEVRLVQPALVGVDLTQPLDQLLASFSSRSTRRSS